MKFHKGLKLFSLTVNITLLLTLSSCNSSTSIVNSSSDTSVVIHDSLPKEKTISSRVFMIDSSDISKGFAYHIEAGDFRIDQTTIPAIQGNQTFKSAEDAQKVADIMIRKIQHDSIPSVTPEELQRLGIIK